MAQQYNMAQPDTMQDYYRAQQYNAAQVDTMQDYHRAQEYAMAQDYTTAQDDDMADDQSNSLSSNPYRVSVMPDEVPSIDVSEQTWSDSATNIPEEEVSEGSSLNGTYQEMPSPTATKEGLQGPPEPNNHLSKHVLSKSSASLATPLRRFFRRHSRTGSPYLKLWLEVRLMIDK